ncbi:MAG: Ig-like domain-containing protein [Nitrospiraceae bacterium]|nr:Ig-like domain-containing protein [Nitrospiraceae bacterium]
MHRHFYRKNHVPYFMALFVLLFSLFACGGGGGGGGSANDGLNTGGTTTNPGDTIATGQAKITGTVQPDPNSPTSAAGQNSGATVYVVGQQDKAATTDANGNFTLTVDATLTGTVLSSPKGFFASLFKAAGDVKQYGLVVISSQNSHGRKTEVQVTEGQANSLDTIYINTVGSITGKAYLQGQTDHTGIRVYIPGTSFQATTDANGNYNMTGVPSGTYDIVRADYPGTVYHYAAVAKVTVASNQATALPDMLLQLSTGPNGSILINKGDAYTTSKTVTVSIAPSANAVLMMVSEDINFQGISWEPVSAAKQYTFAGSYDGGSTARIYARFSDSSALESTPVSDDIFIDTNPLATITSPVNSGVISDTKPAFNWKYAPAVQMPNARYHIQLTTVADTGFSSPLADATTAANVTQYAYAGAALNNLSGYIWRVAMVDEAGKQWSWAGPWSFSIDLSTVTLLKPDFGSYVNKAANDTGITFMWQANANASTYELALCRNDASLSCGTAYTVTAPGISKQILPISTGDGLYNWAVTPIDANGVRGKRSDVWQFDLDKTVPGIVLVSPSGGAQNVSKLSPITVQFDDALDGSTIISPATNFTLNSGAVPGTVSYSVSANTATFTPASTLGFGVTYAATVTTAIKDPAGNALFSGQTWTFSTKNVPEQWTFAADGGSSSLNYSTANEADTPQMAVLGNGLFAFWSEAGNIRGSVYSGSTWSFIDGGGATSTISSAGGYPRPAVYGNELYLLWISGGTVNMKKYDANGSWTSVSGGAMGFNYDYMKTSSGNAIAAANKLYAIWSENNNSSILQIRAKVYTAGTFSFIDGGGANGINYDPTRITSGSPAAVAMNDKLYIAWTERNVSGIDQIRIKVYNDSTATWSFIDGGGANGVNADGTKNAAYPSLAFMGNTLYASWAEQGASVNQIRVAAYSSGTWSFIDNGGINKSPTNQACNPKLAVLSGVLYATWAEGMCIYDPNGDEIRVAAFGNGSWAFVDGGAVTGLNLDSTKMAYAPQITIYNNKPYITWAETNASTGTSHNQALVKVGQ